MFFDLINSKVDTCNALDVDDATEKLAKDPEVGPQVEALLHLMVSHMPHLFVVTPNDNGSVLIELKTTEVINLKILNICRLISFNFFKVLMN